MFSLNHDIELYPVRVVLDGAIRTEIVPEEEMSFLEASNEQELIEILKKIFNSRKTKKIIHALLAQVASVDPEPDDGIPF